MTVTPEDIAAATDAAARQRGAVDTLPAAARPRVLRWACARHGVETVY